jgi:hypothetical protein
VSKAKSTSTELKKAVKTVNCAIDTLVKEDEKLQKQRKEVGKEAIGKLKELINMSPHIEAVRWNQYTPFFNDGEECTFQVNELEIKLSDEINGSGDREADEHHEEEFINFGEFGDQDITEYLNERTDVINFKEIATLGEVVEACNSVFDRLKEMEDTLEGVFGDHVQVTVTRKGIDIDKFEDHN